MFTVLKTNEKKKEKTEGKSKYYTPGLYCQTKNLNLGCRVVTMSKFPLSERSRRENSNTYVSIYIFSLSYNIPPNPLSIFLELSRWVGNVCELNSTKHSKGFHAANC